MDVQCPKCHQTVVIRRELGESEKLVTHCPTCETAFIVKRKPKAPPREPETPLGAEREATATPLPAGSNWHIKKQDGTILSFQSIRTLQTWVIAGIVSHDDYISRKGVQWKRIGALPELASFIEKTRKLHEDTDAGDVTPPPSPSAQAAIRPALAPVPDEDDDSGILPVPAAELGEAGALGEPSPSAADAFAPTKTSWTHDELPVGGRPATRRESKGWRWVFLAVLLFATVAIVALFVLPLSDLIWGPEEVQTPPGVAPVERARPASEGERPERVAAAGPETPHVAPENSKPKGDGDEMTVGAIEIVDRPSGSEGTTDEADGDETAAMDEASAAKAAERAAAARAAEERAAEARRVAQERAEAARAEAERRAAEARMAAEKAAEKAAAEKAAAEKAAAEKAAAEKAAAEKARREKEARRKARAEARSAKSSRREERTAKASAEKRAVPSISDGYDSLMDQANDLFSKNPSRAAVLYAKASRAQPGLVEPVSQLGWCYLKMGNSAKAFQYFKKAIRMSPRYTDSYRGLARAYERAGYSREACEEYRRYLDKVPSGSGRAKRTRARMQKLGCGS